MGSIVEINDTLQITEEQGFPARLLDIAKHRKNPIRLEDLTNKTFNFWDKPGARKYHTPPIRCFLVQNIKGKWLYWGHVIVFDQRIRGETKETQTTSGRYRITKIYDPEYQELVTRNESPKGKSFFD